MQSPWRGTALIIYTSKGTKRHRKIILKLLISTLLLVEKDPNIYSLIEGEEWKLGPVPIFSRPKWRAWLTSCHVSWGIIQLNSNSNFFSIQLFWLWISSLLDGSIYSVLMYLRSLMDHKSPGRCSLRHVSLCMHGHARLAMGICKSYSAYSKVRRRSSFNDRFIVNLMVEAGLRSLYFQLKNGLTKYRDLYAWSVICMEIWPNKHTSEKIQASLKNIVISRWEHHHSCSMMGTRFSWEKNNFILLNGCL